MVLLPYEITLFSNGAGMTARLFDVLLPYEITLFSNLSLQGQEESPFYYLMKLHYSQTYQCRAVLPPWFYYLMKLHYSQTLWCASVQQMDVLLPYEITLFSNDIPLDIIKQWFYYLMKLHYSQTTFGILISVKLFYYLMKLHYSQTINNEQDEAD